MALVRVAPIVEGHGEVEAVPVLLRRVYLEQLDVSYVDVLRPIRQPKSKLPQTNGLERAPSLAAAKLSERNDGNDIGIVLLLIDADDDCPVELGPTMRQRMIGTLAVDVTVTCVLAVVEFETWFIAAAESLASYLHSERAPGDPETARVGKPWIKARFRGVKYSETVDQARMTAGMNLELCAARSPSFRRLASVLRRYTRGLP